MAYAHRRRRRLLTRGERRLVRVVIYWAIPPAAAAAVWAWLREPGGRGGGYLLIAAFVGLWPLLTLAAEFGVPHLAQCVVPDRMRLAHRDRHPGMRPHIPLRLQRAIRTAYGRRCVSCGHRGHLQLEHIKPWSAGGKTSLWNMSLLCQPENRIKSDYWTDGSYNPWEGRADEPRAKMILGRELRARRNVLRWLTVAWILALT